MKESDHLPSKEQLEEARHSGYRTYGYFWAFCKLNRSCETCDRRTRFWCEVKRKIEEHQTKRIMRICK